MLDDIKLKETLSVNELLIIGTALKSSKAIINEETARNSTEEGIDEALKIVEKIIGKGSE
ncbi:hypothetical protein P8629_03270 [Hydrogenovibrio sp. 3SP14C1]|uniref:hypothetical protein n=1 Tax=Hydrogenovibrio sp. 3SP14C1 TaxID=3038774 RepID=UPI002416FC77|nr:hypothetical protein [Hydrogenovibrio sp. 3SP14C1]MDG4812020.1 hypothetical protein [Hydrogenovibrio sp. 3SP14C1]